MNAKASRATYDPAWRAATVDLAKQRIAYGDSVTAIAAEAGVPAPTLYGWLKADGVLFGSDKKHLPKRNLVTKADPVPGTVMIAVDLETFVRDHRDRIIKQLCLGKREAIKTAVIELLRSNDV